MVVTDGVGAAEVVSDDMQSKFFFRLIRFRDGFRDGDGGGERGYSRKSIIY